MSYPYVHRDFVHEFKYDAKRCDLMFKEIDITERPGKKKAYFYPVSRFHHHIGDEIAECLNECYTKWYRKKWDKICRKYEKEEAKRIKEWEKKHGNRI